MLKLEHVNMIDLFRKQIFLKIVKTLTSVADGSGVAFLDLFQKIENMQFAKLDFGNSGTLSNAFGIVKTAIQLLEEGLSSKGVFDTKK